MSYTHRGTVRHDHKDAVLQPRHHMRAGFQGEAHKMNSTKQALDMEPPALGTSESCPSKRWQKGEHSIDSGYLSTSPRNMEEAASL